MNPIEQRLRHGSPLGKRLLSVAALVALGCGGRVDLGHSIPTGTPGPVTDPHELSAQTTNLAAVDDTEIDSLLNDGEFLFFLSSRNGEHEEKVWRCQKSNCLATLAVIANPVRNEGYGLRLNAHQLGWPYGNTRGVYLCDVPDCQNPHQVPGWGFDIWDESVGYWYESPSSLYRCPLSGCVAGRALLTASLPTQQPPQDFALVDGRIYFSLEDSIMRVSADGSTAAERLTLGNVTEWTTSVSGKGASPDVAILDMKLDGPYVYAALRVGNQNANQTLGCDTCKAGIAVARWRYADTGSAREWVLNNDADLAHLVHLQVFDGEVVWGTLTGELWSCVADRCSSSKRQIGIEDAASVTYLQPGDDVAMDEQAIYWLSVPCAPTIAGCGSDGHRPWTLKRTPRIPR